MQDYAKNKQYSECPSKNRRKMLLDYMIPEVFLHKMV